MQNIHIQKTPILGTSTVVLSAWEPSKLMGEHSTIQFDLAEGAHVWGRIGTNPDAKLYAHLPAMSEERSNACREAYTLVYHRAYAAILAEYPEAMNGDFDMGEIRITTEK